MLITIKGLVSAINFSKNYKNFWMQSLKADPSNCVEIRMHEFAMPELNANIFMVGYSVCQNIICYSVKSSVFSMFHLMKQQKIFKFPMNLIKNRHNYPVNLFICTFLSLQRHCNRMGGMCR